MLRQKKRRRKDEFDSRYGDNKHVVLVKPRDPSVWSKDPTAKFKITCYNSAANTTNHAKIVRALTEQYRHTHHHLRSNLHLTVEGVRL